MIRLAPLTLFLAVATARPAVAQPAAAPAVRADRLVLDVQKVEPLGGESYGAVGPYDELTGTIRGEVDPLDPQNALIVDLALAPVNARGMVEYAAEFVLVKPRDMSKANGVLRYDAPNRGNLLTMPPDPALLRRGFVILHAAWQGDVPKSRPERLTLAVPVATNRDGSAITGTYRTELVTPRPASELPLPGGTFNNSMLPYSPASLDNSGLGYSLTRRRNETDPRLVIPSADWRFATTSAENPFPGTPDAAKVSLKGGFDPRYLYEVVYEARDPRVLGLGLAAVRDYVSFFRSQAEDSQGHANPLAGRVQHTIGVGISQAGNLLKTFVHLGFNCALDGSRVFDGVFAQVAPRLTSVNVRFGAPGGGSGLRTDHTGFGTAPRGLAPDYDDPLTGRRGGVMKRASANGTAPKLFLGLSGTEFWMLQGSPVLNDPLGLRDLEQPEDARVYFYASTQHGGPAGARWDTSRSVYPAGVMNEHDDAFRALFLALADWVVRGIEPPPSQVPRVADKTLVRPDEVVFPAMKGVSFPVDGRPTRIPDFEYRGWYDDWSVFDFGPRFAAADESGIADYLPPRAVGRAYALLVPQVDQDGLDVAGIRSVFVQAPLGTSLDFNYPADPGMKDLLGLAGSYIPFHATKAARVAAGDSRLSLEERYGTQQGYVDAVKRAAERLVKQRFLLQEDADRLVERAERNPVLP
jgi:hypothetical protein